MNWKLTNQTNPNAYIITAHPDDETIFCGGTILSYPSWNWHVICVTMQTQSLRPQEFNHAIDMFRSLGVANITGITLNQHDEGQELSIEETVSWKQLIGESVSTPDIVFTHNSEGEYGHPHHRSINKIANELFPNVWEFVCPGATNVAPQPFKSITNVVPLTQDILNRKMEIFNRSYTTQLACWRELSDLMQYEFKTGPELFTQNQPS